MKKAWTAFAICIALTIQVCISCASPDFRSMMLDAEAAPQEFGSLSQSSGCFPIPCSPDDFLSMLKGNQDETTLKELWTALSFTRAGDGKEMDVELPDGGYITFPCTDAHIWRYFFSDIRLLDKTFDVELICFGVPDNYNYAFVFQQGADGWAFIDCLFAFDQPALESNSEVAWLVGNGCRDSSQESRQYEQWYNVLTRKVEASFVTTANKVACIDGVDRYDTRILSRSIFYTYT